MLPSRGKAAATLDYGPLRPATTPRRVVVNDSLTRAVAPSVAGHLNHEKVPSARVRRNRDRQTQKRSRNLGTRSRPDRLVRSGKGKRALRLRAAAGGTAYAS